MPESSRDVLIAISNKCDDASRRIAKVPPRGNINTEPERFPETEQSGEETERKHRHREVIGKFVIKIKIAS